MEEIALKALESLLSGFGLHPGQEEAQEIRKDLGFLRGARLVWEKISTPLLVAGAISLVAGLVGVLWGLIERILGLFQ